MRISPSLLRHLGEASEASGRTITAEVEARLRDSLAARTSDGLVLLRLDTGLMAWLRAIDAIRFLGLSFEETVIHLLRTATLEFSDHDVWWKDIVDNLPEPVRSANQATPRYQRLVGKQ